MVNIKEYEIQRAKINNLHHIISNIQLLLSSIGNSNICPFCRSKVDVNALKKEYNNMKIAVNLLDSGMQYLNVED